MRNVYVISYDVANDKRLRKMFKTMCRFGDPLQYSVFRCELTAVEKQVLKQELWDFLNLAEDRVMLLDLGPVGARGDACAEFWGTPRMELPSRSAAII